MLTTVKIIKYLCSMNPFKDLKVTKNLMNLPKKFCEFPPRSLKNIHKNSGKLTAAVMKPVQCRSFFLFLFDKKLLFSGCPNSLE